MMVNFMMNPVYTGIMDSQMTNINQYVRGWARINGEGVGLRSIPDKRKMDYGYRDVMSMFMSMYGVELAYRLMDEKYFAKNLTRILDLSSMDKRYAPERIHTMAHDGTFPKALLNNPAGPAHYPNYHIPKALDSFIRHPKSKLSYKELPYQLHELMLGSLVDTGSYDTIPTNLENLAHTMEKRGQKTHKVDRIKLLAHHFRRVFLPEEYLREHLKPQSTDAEYRLLKNHMKQMNEFSREIRWATEPTRPDEAFRRLSLLSKQPKGSLLRDVEKALGHGVAQKTMAQLSGQSIESVREAFKSLNAVYQGDQNRLHTLASDLVKLGEKDFKQIYQGVHWNHFGTLWQMIRAKGLKAGLAQFNHFRALSKSPLITQMKAHPMALSHVHHVLQQAKHDPTLSQSKKLMDLAKHSPSQLRTVLKEQGFGDFIGNVFKKGWHTAAREYEASKAFSESGLMGLLRQEVILPKLAHKLQHLKDTSVDKVKVYAMLDDLTHKMVTSKRMRGLFDGGKFWLKLPLSIVFYFMTTGVISNILDNKYVQPYQRDIAKAGVNPREFMKPLFWSLFPAVGAFVGLMRMDKVKKMGYVGSFALAGGVATLGYMALTFAWFRHTVKSELAKVRRGEKPAFNPETDNSMPSKNRGAINKPASVVSPRPVAAAWPAAQAAPWVRPAQLPYGPVNPFRPLPASSPTVGNQTFWI